MKKNNILNLWLVALLGTVLVINSSYAKSPIKDLLNMPHQEYNGDSFISEIESTPSQYTGGKSPFLVKKRSAVLKKNNCITCHKDGVTTNSDLTKTHNDIRLVHAAKQGMTCLTCHDVNQVELLKNVNNTQIVEIDHAYISCQNCHFTQTRDWAGGAHGKRVRIWADPRIIYNCTECHDPHNPTFKKRWPKIISTLPEKK